MSGAFFEITDESPQAGHYVATPATTGPWSNEAQHGGPPNALAVRIAERLVAADTERADLVALRIAAEFTGPVPVGDVTARATLVRAARSAALVDVVLHARSRDCLHARVWFVRADADGTAPVAASEPPADLPGLDAQWHFGYADHIEWRVVSGDAVGPGPAAVWTRPRIPLLAGARMSGLQRAALVADSASGVSSVLSWDEWSFINVDLDVHLARDVVGDWLLLDAVTQLGGAGAAIARSTLSDGAGVVGAGLQTLVIARIAP